MSYREENDQVILTMSREQFAQLRGIFRAAMISSWPNTMSILQLENSLNEGNLKWTRYQVPFSGNPNYTPYQVEEEKS